MPLNIQRTFIGLFMQLKFIMRMPKMAHCCWVFLSTKKFAWTKLYDYLCVYKMYLPTYTDVVFNETCSNAIQPKKGIINFQQRKYLVNTDNLSLY